MATPDTWDAEKYRHIAEEIRSVAETMQYARAREIMLRLASDYDAMAARVETIADTIRKFGESRASKSPDRR
jgi:hypothetical protein